MAEMVTVRSLVDFYCEEIGQRLHPGKQVEMDRAVADALALRRFVSLVLKPPVRLSSVKQTKQEYA